MQMIEQDAFFAQEGDRETARSLSEDCNRASSVFKLSSICTKPILARRPDWVPGSLKSRM